MQDSNRIPVGVRGAAVPPTVHDQHDRKHGASPLVAAIEAITRRIHAGIELYRQHAARRMSLRQLQYLDERLLRDVGLTRGDMIDLRLGVITPNGLDARRESRGRIHSLESVTNLATAQAKHWNELAKKSTATAARCA